MIAAHTDTTSLSRLGKVWSIVEADELAQLTIWKISRGTLQHTFSEDGPDILPLGEKIFLRTLPEKVNAFRMTSEGKVLLGFASGKIEGYDIRSPTNQCVSITAHGNSPVVALDLINDDSVVSASLDGCLRISSVTSGNLIGGGKLTKRLGENEILSCMHVHKESGRVLIGTDKGRVFILDASSGSLAFLHVINSPSYPVRCISTCEETLLIAAGTSLSKYRLPGKGEETNALREYSIQPFGNAQVYSCLSLPKEDLVVAGLGDGSVAIYKSSALVYSRTFAHEAVNELLYSDGVLWAGCDDGRIVEIIFPGSISEDAMFVSSCVSHDVSPVNIIRHSPKNDACSPVANTNPSCLKSSQALADDDSDDEWRKGLFTN